MKTVLELFLTTTITDGFHIVRKALDLSQECRDPDSVATEYIEFLFKDSTFIHDREKYILHSTSWRYEKPRTVVLTYLVYADSFSFRDMNPMRLAFNDLIISHSDNPKVPRPLELPHKSVIAHGIRHLAYLIKNDENSVYAKMISSETVQLFETLESQLAGRLAN